MAMQLSGSLVISGSIVASAGITGSFSGNATSASYADTLGGLPSSSFAPAGTFNTVSSSYATTSGSLSTRVTNLESTSSTLTSASASFATTSGSIAGRVTLIEGQYATTGSNTFTGPQYVSQASNAISFTSTASLYTDGGLRVTKDSFVSGTAYFNNVIVYGTASIQYVTSSQVNVGTNIITVNTDTPAIRFGGLAVFDSGSTQLTGSILWDSEKNNWIYSNPSGSTYNSGMLMNGPKNTGSLGTEQGTLNNYITKGQGGDHITSSQIIDDGTTVQIPGNLQVTGSLINTGAATFSSSALITGVLTLSSTITNGTYTYTLPSATGTLALTSALSSYLPLTGGTLTGALNGTSASFSSTIQGTILTATSYFKSDTYRDSRAETLISYQGSNNIRLGSGVGADYLTFLAGGTLKATLDASGNLGLGVTPSAWAFFKAVQVNGGNSFVGYNNQAEIWSNSFYDGASKYYANGFATRYAAIDGRFEWYQAPSGTAGNAITFTQAMTLTAAGNLGIGTPTPALKFVISNGGGQGLEFDPIGYGASIALIQSYNRTTSVYGSIQFDALSFRFGNGGTERMRIWETTGNVNIGTTPASDSGYKLDVNGTGRFSSHLISNSPGGGVNAATFYDRTGAVGAAVDQYGTLAAYSGILNNNGDYGSGASGTPLVFKAGAVEQFRVSATNMVVAGTVTATSESFITSGDGAGKMLKFTGGTTKYNFMIAVQQNVNNALEITPSTAAGGSTFSTPALTIASTGAATFSGQITQGLNQLRSASGTQAVSTTGDVFRFLNGASSVNNGCYSAIFHIWVSDNNTGANAYSATYAVQTTSNGQTDTAFTVLSSVTRGTSPVSSLSLISDGGGGAVKVSLTTSATPTAGVTYQCSAIGIF